MQQPRIQSAVRLIPHRQINPGLFVYNAFLVREGIKSSLSVITSHTAFTDTAESHLRCCQNNR